jgi:hypothetical protein
MRIFVSGSSPTSPINLSVSGSTQPSVLVDVAGTVVPAINLSVDGTGVPGSSIDVSVPSFVNEANRAISSSYAGTASFAFVTLGNIESASYAQYASTVSWSNVVDVPQNIVSSSTQIDYTEIPNIPDTISSSSYVEFTNVANKPVGLVSSSLQIDFPETASYSLVAEAALNIPPLPIGIISSSIQVEHDLTTGWTTSSHINHSVVSMVAGEGLVGGGNIMASRTFRLDTGSLRFTDGVKKQLNAENVISSSTQAILWSVASSSIATSASFAPTILPVGVVSASSQINYNHIQNQPTTIATASIANAVAFTNVTNLPTLISSSVQVSYTGLSNVPVGIVSASTQVTPLLPSGTVSSSAQINYSQLQNIPVGILSSSTQFNALSNTSASFANTTTWNGVNNRPVGIVSSSAQASTWTVATASVANSASFAVSASWAPTNEGGSTTWNNITNKPIGLVSSSAQVVVQDTTGIAAIATTGSNVLVGNQLITGSVFANTGSFQGLHLTTIGDIKPGPGEIVWSSTEGTIKIGTGFDGVVSTVNQEIDYVVRNSSGGTIGKGAVLYATGATVGSNRITVDLMVADGTIREIDFVGLSRQEFNPGINGVSIYFGYLTGVDTRGTVASALAVGDENWQAGDSLYVHPSVPGKLTNIRPKHDIYVGRITNRHQSLGVIFVRPSSFGHMDDLHDVNINTGSLSSGQLLVYNQTLDDWENSRTLSGSYIVSGGIELTHGITGSFQGTSSFALSASFAPTILPTGIISSSGQISYTELSNIPVGLISSSAQFNTLSNTSASFALNTTWNGVNNKPVGIVSSSDQVLYANLSGVPVGIVSSSTQASAWTVASSSVAVSSSNALTASYALNGGTGGTPFNLTVQQTGSAAGGNISVLNFAGSGIASVAVAGETASISISAGVAESASFATTASFAVSASWAPSTGGGSEVTFETVSKNLKSWNYSLNYTGSTLSNIVYTDGVNTITKTLNYTGDKLTSIVLSGDTPIGISLTKTLSYTGDTLTSISYS